MTIILKTTTNYLLKEANEQNADAITRLNQLQTQIIGEKERYYILNEPE